MNGYADLGFEPTGLDVLDRRRYNVSRPESSDGYDPFSVSRPPVTPRPAGPAGRPDGFGVPRPPARPMAAPAPAAGGTVGRFGGGGYASTGDALLDHIRNTAMADASARSRGARFAAMNAAGNDPSLAAYGGLEGLLSGQGDAARSLNQGALARLQELDRRKWDEYLLRLQHEWQVEAQRQAAEAALWGAVGGIGGSALGGWLAPGGFWKGAGK